MVKKKKETFWERHFYLSWYRIRILRFGFGWRSAGWSRTFRGKRFYWQTDPVYVARAFACWVQWTP